MRYLCFLPFLLSLCTAAQPTQELVQTRILDASQIYANYRWKLDIRSEAMLRETLGDSLSALIFQQTQEHRWPDGFKSAQDREENRYLFCDLKAYLYYTLPIGKVLLVVPASENRHLPIHLQTTEDWYIVIRTSAVESAGPSPNFPQDLGAQVDFLLGDFLGGFAKSMVKEEDKTQFSLYGQVMPSRILLEGARTSIFISKFPEGQTGFFSTFPPVLRREDAQRQYRDILQRLSSTLFNSCPMANQGEIPLGKGGVQTTFQAFDYTGDIHPRCKGLRIEVQLLPSFAQSGQKPVWYVQLAIIPTETLRHSGFD